MKSRGVTFKQGRRVGVLSWLLTQIYNLVIDKSTASSMFDENLQVIYWQKCNTSYLLSIITFLVILKTVLISEILKVSHGLVHSNFSLDLQTTRSPWWKQMRNSDGVMGRLDTPDMWSCCWGSPHAKFKFTTLQDHFWLQLNQICKRRDHYWRWVLTSINSVIFIDFDRTL